MRKANWLRSGACVAASLIALGCGADVSPPERTASSPPPPTYGPCGGPFARPERRFTNDKTRAEPFKGAVASPDLVADPDPYPMTLKTLPSNASVDLLRSVGSNRNPSACAFALVRVVDAGGVVAPGSVFVVDVKSLSASSTGPAPVDAVRDERDDRRKLALAVAEEELRTNRCSEAHADQMHRNLAGMVNLFEHSLTTATSSENYAVASDQLIVIHPAGDAGTQTPSVSGTVHLLVLSYDPSMKLVVEDGQGYEVKDESPFAGLVAQSSELPVRSRVVQGRAGVPYRWRLVGRGCAEVVAVRRY